MIFDQYKNVHILFLDDPGIYNFNEPAIRSHYIEYASIVDHLKTQGFRISRVYETIDKITTIVSMAELSITPDTGIGHLSGALGTPTIMLFFGANPVLWKTSETSCIIHSKARELFSINAAIYDQIWDSNQKDYYITEIDGKKIGTSDIAPEIVFKKVCKILGPLPS
jgi:ADP-heptose:LPS heptosyltransferase